MPGPPSLKRLPRWVDSRKFAQQGVELEGRIPADELPRLSQAVTGIEGPITAKLRFDMEEGGLRTVKGPLRARVKTTCQRCMEETELEIVSQLSVGIVRSDEKAKQLPKSLEPWIVSGETPEADLYEAVEDELLLDLPMVVYHDYQCIDENLYSAGETAEASTGEKQNPFQVLEQLKGRKRHK